MQKKDNSVSSDRYWQSTFGNFQYYSCTIVQFVRTCWIWIKY